MTDEHKQRPVNLATPAGLGDLLGDAVRDHRALVSAVESAFDRCAYEPVITPIYEYAELLLPATQQGTVSEAFRFVEPDTGKVVVLRPDITPQVARVVATHLRSALPPFRLRYSGTVIRRTAARADTERAVAQAGIELIGVRGLDGDVEVALVCVDAVRRATDLPLTLELRDAGIAKSVLGALPGGLREEVSAAVAAKDAGDVERLLRTHDVEELEQVLSLCTAYGPSADDLPKFEGAEPDVHARIKRLVRLGDALRQHNVDAKITFDLGIVETQPYYSGASFVVMTRGAGRPVASGGRYDHLLAHFGRPMPATGAAVDISVLSKLSTNRPPADRRIVLAGHLGTARFLQQYGLRVEHAGDLSLDELIEFANERNIKRALRVSSSVEVVRNGQVTKLGGPVKAHLDELKQLLE